MKHLAINFDLRNKPCLVIGSGKAAIRKTKLLARAGAHISLLAENEPKELSLLRTKYSFQYMETTFEAHHLDRQLFVFAATEDPKQDRDIAHIAKGKHLFINVYAQPELSDFILPISVERGPLSISISSGAHYPVLTRLAKSRIESAIPAAYGIFSDFIDQSQPIVDASFSSLEERHYFWHSVLDGAVGEAVLSGDKKRAQALLQDAVKNYASKQIGEVYLVGAGPGDPDLLTFKALRLMHKSQVVLYDRLVSSQILDLLPEEAEKIYVGKARADHALPQKDINQQLIDLALSGKRVLRLKGGDPFIFGRGGEEIEGLSAHQIPFQVVPGITAASGCAAYAGIPLTHRDYAQSVRFITGHLKDNSCDLPWSELIAKGQTLVFYMGLVGLAIISEKLIQHGNPSTTPVALIQQGTLPTQKVLIGTLKTIVEIVKASNIKAPTLLIVGDTVGLREQLNWYD